ncbi:hypothetical protein LCGC14_3030650 [marine sediment metagenome]|uniref:Peptidase M28 domain-containing protein n=1 Tax=marine sediment metagenome TaxID=412755 RepID=A0A0F8Z0A7_9ZZZZ
MAKIGCFVLIETIKEIIKSKKIPLYDLIFTFSAQEEIGCKGAIACVKKYKPDLFLETDVTFASDYLDDELEKQVGKCHLGKGVVIYRGCGLDYKGIRLLENIAKKHKIKFQTQSSDPNTPYTSEHILTENVGTKILTLALPLRNMHCPIEIINMKDAVYCINLIKAFCLSGGLSRIL